MDMPNDPAITSDDLRQDFELIRDNKGKRVTVSAYVQRRRIDAARRYTRRGTAVQRLPQRISLDPITKVISEERARLVHEALRRATPSQQTIAQLLMRGRKRCEIARQLGISRSAVTHMLQRLRPLLKIAR